MGALVAERSGMEYNPWQKVMEDAGVRMEASEDYAYVYLDTPEAVRLAKMLLPDTPRRRIAEDGGEVWVYKVRKRD